MEIEGDDDRYSDSFEDENVASDDEYADAEFEDAPPSEASATELHRNDGQDATKDRDDMYVQQSRPTTTSLHPTEGCPDPPSQSTEDPASVNDTVPSPTTGTTFSRDQNACAQDFLVAKIQKLRGMDDAPTSSFGRIRIPKNLLCRLEHQNHHLPCNDGVESRTAREPSPIKAACGPRVPACVVDRVHVQTLLSSMRRVIDTPDPPLQYPPRSLFAFTARHCSRLDDQRWAMQIDALEVRRLASHDTITWIAEHMRRHRAAHAPDHA
ncbi:Aste57867_20126 [Aphanomyces stellatus]|uniref:Aste57867_20126 protein n=1 Tax=Aphanomyces stellatus TaxID=120398 RepID=A0A485LFG1_9STRA|nr:hypothetical protein As57867_020060 [Aphanomyces stellatus]VFT96821.1 Aste57867_20126 [Aphanomyces stellatus]